MELQLKSVTKSFKDKTAVDDVNLTFTPGIWGLLGANGAGKTTLMKMVSGVLEPSAGSITYNGEEIEKLGMKYREIFSILPQDFGYPKEFNVQDYLFYIAAYKGVEKAAARKRIDELLQMLHLTDVRKKKIAKLSGGMRRRVGIAQALINDPEVLILDEPTAGLDPAERIRFKKYISEFAHDRIVLLSTHIVSDVEFIAWENAIMKNGKIIDVGTTEELVKEINGKVWMGIVSAAELHSYERNLRIVSQKFEADHRVSVRYLSEASRIAGSVQAEPRLEDLFLWLFPDETQKIQEEVQV